MENKKYKIWRIIIIGVLSILLLLPSCLWGTRPLFAEGEAPTKQTLGNMIITLLASFGVNTYITVANGAQWVADNYDHFVSTVSGLKTAYQIYEEVNSSYDATTGKGTLSADAYNSLAQYVRNFMSTYDVASDSEPVTVGEYITTGDGSFGRFVDKKCSITYSWSNNSKSYNAFKVTNNNVRVVVFRWPNSSTMATYLISDEFFQYNYIAGSLTPPSSEPTINPLTYTAPDNKTYYMYGLVQTHYYDMTDCSVPWYYEAATNERIWYYTYGCGLVIGGEQEWPVSYAGTDNLNDMVSTTDQNAVFDWSRVAGIDKTLAEILEAVNELALTDAWDTVNFPVPDAKEPVPSVPVPDNTPIPPWWDNIPELEAPTCPTLSACIVSGARAVSDNISSLMNLHSELAIYTGVGLSLGLALLIIGAFRR